MGIITVGRGYKGKYKVINVTSWAVKSSNVEEHKWANLSPFHYHSDIPLEVPCTPYRTEVQLKDNLTGSSWTCKIAENIWQGLKSFKLINSVDEWDWEEGKRILHFIKPLRYPRGKNAKVYCHVDLFNRELLGFAEARKRIYMPVYKESVSRFPDLLDELVERSQEENLALWDFDACQVSDNSSLYKIMVNGRKFGHAMALAIILSKMGAKMDIPVGDNLILK